MKLQDRIDQIIADIPPPKARVKSKSWWGRIPFTPGWRKARLMTKILEYYWSNDKATRKLRERMLEEITGPSRGGG